MTRLTNVDDSVIRTLLAEHFLDVAGLEPLAGGLFSSAYGFSAGGREYVVRTSSAPHAADGFAKDEYAGQVFASSALPIPKVVTRGLWHELDFAISERAPGRTLAECTVTERCAVLPGLLDTLEALGRADTSLSGGYGVWGGDGNGRYTSWQAFLADISANDDGGFYDNWHSYFDATFLERDLFFSVYDRMVALSTHCPNLRQLVHNDYQFENVLASEGRISGVIDWANAFYGDPLYDVAWLNFISIQPGWWFVDGAELLSARFGEAPNFATRILCYELHVGLDHLRFYANQDRYDDYLICREWLAAKLGDTPA